MMKNKLKVAGQLLIIILVNRIIAANETNLCDVGAVDYENYTVSTTELCDCDRKPVCVRKCCRNGFFHYHDEDLHTGFYLSICIKNDTTNFSVPIYDGMAKQYDLKDGFMVGMLNCNNKDWYQYFKMNNADPRQRFFIQKDGTLYYPFYKKIYSNDRYCVDERDGLTAYLCFTPPDPFSYIRKIIHVSAKLVPIPFLVVTFVVYAILPKPNLNSIALMFHVLALIPGYTLVATAQYYPVEDDQLCQALGLSAIFFMMASFFWMNVICLDVWYTFSGLRGFSGQKKETKFPKMFCLYAWGVPSILVLILFLLNTYVDKTSQYYPGIVSPICFLNDKLPTLVYYFVPILILIVVNVVLFILTAINIQKVRRETSMLKKADSQKSGLQDEEKYKMYWKLLFVMGINPVINTHVIQTISWALGWQLSENTVQYIQYVKDFAHTMYGIFIFVIFVCKKNVWVQLMERFYNLVRKKNTYSTPPTATSKLTTTDASGNRSSKSK